MLIKHKLQSGFVSLALLALSTVACLNAEGVAPPPANVVEDRDDRNDCVAIGGTAFRSNAERDWYRANCSAWPPIPVDAGPARTAAPAYVPPPAECIAMRGKPYSSNEQRAWYLANCNGQQPRPESPPPGQGGANAQLASSENRANCDQIRGTPYQGPGERDWYLKNCLGQQPSDPQAGSDNNASRTNCDEIRGTPYRSANERAWYLGNCQQPAAAQQQQLPSQQQVLIPQPRQQSNDDRNDDDRGNSRNSNGRNSRDRD